VPPGGAGEADVQTPLVLHWAHRHRAALGLRDGDLTVCVTSKDSDMLPICATHAALDAEARFRTLLLRSTYERASRRFTQSYVDTRAFAEAVHAEARRQGRVPAEHLANVLFAVALAGCDFVRRPKGCTAGELLAQTGARPVLRLQAACAPVGSALMCGCAYVADASAARGVLRHSWSVSTKARGGHDGLTLGDALVAMRGTAGLGNLRLTVPDCECAESMWRAALWVTFYWTAAALGPSTFARFHEGCCARAGHAEMSAPFGFAVTFGGARPSARHASEADVLELALPALCHFDGA
jgi:hypothetical protein